MADRTPTPHNIPGLEPGDQAEQPPHSDDMLSLNGIDQVHHLYTARNDQTSMLSMRSSVSQVNIADEEKKSDKNPRSHSHMRTWQTPSAIIGFYLLGMCIPELRTRS